MGQEDESIFLTSLRPSLIRVKYEDRLFEKKIWCIDDVTKVLEVSKGHIYNLTSRKEIPFIKKGRRGRLYFIPEEILKWLKEGEL